VVRQATSPFSVKLSKKVTSYFPEHENFRKSFEYYSESSEDSEYELSPIPALNVLTNKSQKEFLLDLISQIPDGNLKCEYLEKLKSIILEEEDEFLDLALKILPLALKISTSNFQFQIPFSK